MEPVWDDVCVDQIEVVFGGDFETSRRLAVERQQAEEEGIERLLAAGQLLGEIL